MTSQIRSHIEYLYRHIIFLAHFIVKLMNNLTLMIVLYDLIMILEVAFFLGHLVYLFD